MKKSFLFFFLFTCAGLLSAHEFWLQPEKFIYSYADIVNIRFWVGENFEGENWKGNREKVNTLQLWYGGVKDDLSDGLDSLPGDSLVFRICHEGTCMVTYNGTNSFISLEPQKFTAYLLEDGLTDALSYRKDHNETDSLGRELYQRSVKTIFQVGTKKEDTWKQETGLPIDIIPVSNPYTLTGSTTLSLKILFQGQPLPGQLVKVWHRENNSTSVKELTTDNNGIIAVSVSPQGKWMVSTVKMVRLDNNPQAQWQSYWGSCTWGYE
jgi:uncharacterized GH25 family protein